MPPTSRSSTVSTYGSGSTKTSVPVYNVQNIFRHASSLDTDVDIYTVRKLTTGQAAAQLVEALYYKPEGAGSSPDEVDFSIDLILSVALWP
jgi:hypothetical protein